MVCVNCGNKIHREDFPNEYDYEVYIFTGLCQACQDYYNEIEEKSSLNLTI